MIEKYHFGSITIDGKTYTDDMEARWSSTVLSWVRADSHHINVEAVARAVEQNPETIVIGTGESGLAQVTEKAQEEIKAKGIELIIEPTGQAVGTFNQLAQGQKKVIGLFHLTC